MTKNDSMLVDWLNDETPGAYIWRARIGWRFRVMFQFAGTTTMWSLTRRGAERRIQQIIRDEA